MFSWIKNRSLSGRIVALTVLLVLVALLAAIWTYGRMTSPTPAQQAAIALMQHAVKAGAKVVAYDPVALENLAHEHPGIPQAKDMYAALDGADALVICTEWNEFRSPDFADIKRRLKHAVIFDGRNLYRSAQVIEAGFVYASVGRETVRP
mgnify:CR=1 FL=1